MEKILTIVVPTYNMEKYLDKCLTSLIVNDQELLKRLEVLVVIDGAEDRSSEIAHSYQDKYPDTFRVIDKENGNYGSCINRGLKEATGKYIKVLDADDSFDTENFLVFMQKLLNLDVDLIITSLIYVTIDGKTTYSPVLGYQSNKIYPAEELKPMWIHNVTHRTENLKSIGYVQTEGISYTDEEWVFYPMLAVKTFYTLDVVLYKYVVGRDGQTMNPYNWSKNIRNEMIVSYRMLQYVKDLTPSAISSNKYVEQKLHSRFIDFYRRALLVCEMYQSDDLIEFDTYLRKNYNVEYDKLNYVVANKYFYRLKYIRYWREHRLSSSCFLYLRIYRNYLVFKNLIKKSLLYIKK